MKISVKYGFWEHRIILGFLALPRLGAGQAHNSPACNARTGPALNASSAETEIRQDEADDDNEAYDINDGIHGLSLGMFLGAQMWAPSL